MNKTELIESIAKSADISKAAAQRAVDGMFSAIRVSLKRGQMVTLVGFGTFYVGRRKARLGETLARARPSRLLLPRFRSSVLVKR